jgi:starch synthase (maltosyl-transferring)
MLLYGKKTGANAVFATTNFDPHGLREAHVQFPIRELGIPKGEGLVVEEFLTGREFPASGNLFWVRLDPQSNPAEIFRLERGGRG